MVSSAELKIASYPTVAKEAQLHLFKCTRMYRSEVRVFSAVFEASGQGKNLTLNL